jgi:hypothetical protein
MPLFDAYGVELVVAGHEHHYERTFPVRGVLPGSLLTPAPRGSDPAEMDTRDGTVHMIIGGGGHPAAATTGGDGGPPEGALIVGVAPGGPLQQRRSAIVTEPAPWPAHRTWPPRSGSRPSTWCPPSRAAPRPSPPRITAPRRAHPSTPRCGPLIL